MNVIERNTCIQKILETGRHSRTVPPLESPHGPTGDQSEVVASPVGVSRIYSLDCAGG